MRQQKISMFGGLTPTGADGSSAEVLNRLAGLTGQIQDTVFNIAAKKREAEGKQKGEQAGIEAQKTGKKLELEDAGISIHDQAFNQGAMVAYKSQLDIDSKTKLDDLQREFQDDPEGFKQQAESYKAGTLENLPPDLFASTSLDLDAAIANRTSQVKDAFFKKEKERHFGEFTAGMESISDDLSNAARAGKTDQIEILTAKGTERISEALKAGIITPSQAEGMLESAKEIVLSESVIGEIESALTDEPTIETVNSASNKLKEIKKRSFKNLSAPEKDALIAKAESVVNSAISGLTRRSAADKARLQGEIKSIKQEITKAKTNLNAGYNVNQKELDHIIGRAEEINSLTGEESIDIAELQNEIREQQEVNIFSAYPKEKRQFLEAGLVASERAGTLSNEQAEILRRIRSANKNIDSQIESKGIAYFQEQGLGDIGQLLIQNKEDGSFDHEGLVSSLSERKEITLQASAHYAQDISPLTPFEAEQISIMYNGMDSISKGVLLQGMVEGLGDSSLDAFSQINKKGASIMALSGAILTDGGDPSLILQGQELLKEPANRNLLPIGGEEETTFEREIFTRLDSAYATNGPQRGAAIQGIKAAYAALSAKNGAGGGTVDSGRLDQAINVVTGGIVKFNGRGVTAPVRGMSESDFEDLVDSLDEKSFGFMFQELPEEIKGDIVDQIKEHGTLHDVGPGKYLVEIGEGFLVDDDGEPYILDLRRIHEGRK